MRRYSLPLILFIIALAAGLCPPAAAADVRLTDSAGNEFVLDCPPRRAVSLAPGVTEMIIGLGEADSLAGVTYYDRVPAGAAPELVGGFLRPRLPAVRRVGPDAVFAAEIHDRIRRACDNSGIPVIQIGARNLEDVYRNLSLLGRMFGRGDRADEIASDIRADVARIARKTALIPADGRLRVAHVMGPSADGGLVAPGDDSFQHDFIRSAGGIPPRWGKDGSAATIGLAEWRAFNPQVVYGCGSDAEKIRGLLDRPGWRDVDAVSERRILTFPCELTCRASLRSGLFISRLAASLYPEVVFDPENRAQPDAALSSRPVGGDLPFTRKACVETVRYHDFEHGVLLVDLARPATVLSTLEGFRRGITTVGNHGLPAPAWPMLRRTAPSELTGGVLAVLGRKPGATAMLLTGADMDNLAVVRRESAGLSAAALVTAGVSGNAMRMSADRGRYVEPGTINVLVTTNRRLTPRAMTRALITATEAKTAALQDLDVRSSYSGRRSQATGTGTDNIIVVEGAGAPADLTGGHSRLGELIAAAVHDGVLQATAEQNRMRPGRNVFRRLEERGIHIFEYAGRYFDDPAAAERVAAVMEGLLLSPRTAGFIRSALALDDAWRSGLSGSPDMWNSCCRVAANELAGRQVEVGAFGPEDSPLDRALRALAAAAASRAGYKGAIEPVRERNRAHAPACGSG